MLQHPHRRLYHIRRMIGIESVRKEHHTRSVGRIRGLQIHLECGGACKRGQRTLSADAHEPFAGLPKPRLPGRPVYERRQHRATDSAGHAGLMGKQSRAPRHVVALPVRLQPLGFDLRHIHVRGALGFARLALDTQIHHLVHPIAGQRIVGQVAGQRRAQRIGAPSGGVLFLARGHEARAHGAGIAFAARAVAIAFFQQMRKTALSLKAKRRVELVCGIIRAVAQVVSKLGGIDHLARIQQSFGVEERFDFLVDCVQVVAQHLAVEGAAHNSIAVLRGGDTAVAFHQIKRAAGNGI